MGDVDLFLRPQRGGRIDQHLGRRDIAAGRAVERILDFARIGGGERQREPDDLAGGVLRHLDRCRQRAVIGQREGRAVRHHADGAAQADAALLGEVAVDLQHREAPWIGRDVSDAAFQQVLEIAVALLEVVRPEKQPFRPDDLAVPRHSGLAHSTAGR